MKIENILLLILIVLTILITLNFVLESRLDKAFKSYEKGDIVRSLNQFDTLCNKKYAQACYYKGLIYIKNSSFLKHKNDIKELFEKSCNLGYSSACYSLAKEFYQHDINQSILLYSKACNLNDYQSCYILGTIYINILKKDTNKSTQYFKIACENRYAQACFEIGNLYYKKNITIKPEKHNFIFNVEKMYNSTLKPEYDQYFLKAVKYYQKACSLRSSKACFALAKMYEAGKGVAKSKKNSFELFRRSCNWGYEKACKKLSY